MDAMEQKVISFENDHPLAPVIDVLFRKKLSPAGNPTLVYGIVSIDLDQMKIYRYIPGLDYVTTGELRQDTYRIELSEKRASSYQKQLFEKLVPAGLRK